MTGLSRSVRGATPWLSTARCSRCGGQAGQGHGGRTLEKLAAVHEAPFPFENYLGFWFRTIDRVTVGQDLRLLITIHFDTAKETVTVGDLARSCPDVSRFQLVYLIIAITGNENLDLVVSSL